MPRYRERRWPWITAGYAALLAILAAVTAYAYDSAAPANQPIVIRLAVAFLLAIVLIHIRSYFRGDPLWDTPSEFEDALVRQPAARKLNAGFVKLREEVVNSAASRSYFENVLWPRLRALAEARRGDGARVKLTLPPPGRWPSRGPSPRVLADLIDRIEGRG